jgi:hypothetical protein
MARPAKQVRAVTALLAAMGVAVALVVVVD